MLIEQIIKFELRGLGLPGHIYTPTTAYFYDKTKISKKKSSSGLLFTAKILQEAMYLAFSTWAKSVTNLTPKCKILKVFRI